GDGEHRVAPITVSTYASAVVWAPRIGDRFGLVIVDEAHHVGAWCPHEVLEMLTAPARLGLTATPPLHATMLERHLGPIVFSIGIDALVGDSLAEYALHTIPIILDASERARYRTLRGHFGAFYSQALRNEPGLPWRRFMQAAGRSERGRDALAAWRASRAVLAYPSGKGSAR